MVGGRLYRRSSRDIRLFLRGYRIGAMYHAGRVSRIITVTYVVALAMLVSSFAFFYLAADIFVNIKTGESIQKKVIDKIAVWRCGAKGVCK